MRNLIREGKTFQIYSSLETGAKVGMQSVDMVLADLVHKGMIDEEEACIKARDADGLKRRLKKLQEGAGNAGG